MNKPFFNSPSIFLNRSITFVLLVSFSLMLISGCAPIQDKKIRIAVARFSHETCTFAPKPTTIEDWEFRGPPTKDIFDSDGGYIGGFKHGTEDYDNVELVGITSPRGARGGSSGSWNTLEAFEKYSGLIVNDIEQAGELDGVFLSLHGAMAVTGIMKPEAELVRRIRAVVGDTPIFVTLDLHANEDSELSDAADAVFIIKRYPHYDTALQGERAARVMLRTIKGNYKPVMATRKPGVITPSVYQGTGVQPAMDIMERARRWENQNRDAYVSVAFGFAYADVPDVGATVMVVTNNDQELADRIADDMDEYIWRVREAFAGKRLPKTRDGVRMAIQYALEGKTPVIIADHSDRTGGATHILEELIRQNANNFCITTLRDEKAMEKIKTDHKVGDRVSLILGGYSDEFAGNPVKVDAVVELLGTYGQDDVAVIKFGDNNRVIITPLLNQVTTTSIFNRLNINLDEIDIISLKSRVHFRRGFHETGIAGSIIEIDAPGWGPADLSLLPYKNIPADKLYPINRDLKRK